jgi:hypothetical protein
VAFFCLEAKHFNKDPDDMACLLSFNPKVSNDLVRCKPGPLLFLCLRSIMYLY